MAKTNFAALTTEQKTAWAMETWSHARNLSFVNRFVGKGTNAMIQRVTELKKSEKGARAVMTLVADMLTDGVTGDYTLEGNEEALKAFDHVIQLDQLRNANRLEGRMADQKSIVNFRKESKDKLSYWLADRMDQMAFLTLSSVPYTKKNSGGDRPVLATGQNLADLEFAPDLAAAPTANRAFHLTSNGLTSGDGYSAADGTLTPLTYKDLVRIKAAAKDMYIRGIRGKGGQEIYHMFVTPEGMADLKLDADFIANVRHAGVRGDKNSLFAGTDSVMVDGLIIHEFRHVFNTRTATAGNKFGATGNDQGQRALLCGAQALGMADIGPGFWEEDYFDYKNQPGISYGKIFGFTKPQFKGNLYDPDTKDDFSVMCIDTALSA
jgi:N4-gp56 family major capsid protein